MRRLFKRARTEADGAEVVVVGSDSDERARKAEELACERGLIPVPPFDDPPISRSRTSRCAAAAEAS